MPPSVVILYEDSQSEATPEFGLHKLVLRLVYERLAPTPPPPELWELRKQVVGIPRKGDSKLLASLRDDHDALTRSGERLIAVFDLDQVHRVVGASPGTCRPQLCAEISRLAGHATCACLLRENTESLVRALQAGGHLTAVSAETFAEALTKAKRAQGRASRDIVLGEAAREASKPARDQLLVDVPSVAYLVAAVIQALER